MSDKSSNSTSSYAYQKRGDLPSEPSGFYRDAGLSKQEFEIARAAQIIPLQTPERFQHIEGSGGRKARTFRHELPQPSPDFAPPNRSLYEKEWFQKIRVPKKNAEPAHSKALKNIRDR